MAKYKIGEIAKDFGVKVTDVADILTKYFGEGQYKHSTVLESDRLDVLFDHFTQAQGFGTLQEYFDTYDEKIRAKKAKEAEESAKAEASEKKEEAAPVQAQPKEEKKEEKPVAEVKAEAKTENKAEVKAEKPSAVAPAPAEEKKPEQTHEQKDRKPQQKKQPPQKQKMKTITPRPAATPAKGGVSIVEDSALDSSTLGKSVVVDTRKQTNVNLSKYDERLNDIVGEKANKDYGKANQRIKQKNKRKPDNAARRKEAEAKLKRMEQYEKDKKKHLSNIVLPEEMSVSELAAELRMTTTQVIQKLMQLGIFASASQIIDYDTASLVAEDLGATVTKQVVVTIEDKLIDDSDDKDDDLETRDPVVVVMGHVDHGKTSLLDAIRHTSVTSGEAGGITQHIGAYKVKVGDRQITFLDTPGHAAFTSMRARGAQVTDVVILVVAGDDGIMPQTVEAINHAKAAGVPIVVAVNKMDKPESDFDKVMQSLTEYDLVPSAWGGDVECVPVSAATKKGIDDLLETVLLVADMQELKANPNREAKGTVIEAKLDKGRGPVATVLVQNGTLHSGDVIVAGTAVGKIRLMTDDNGRKIQDAGPSTPVEIIGLSEVPAAGDVFHAVKDERMARELVEQRKAEQKEAANKARAVTLDDLFSQIQDGNMKTLNIIVKADVQGSAEAVKSSLEKLSNDEVRVKVIHSAVGGIKESDIMLASASGAIVIGFNVRPDAVARDMAEKNKVDIRLYRIIYDCIEEVETAMKGMLAPKFREVHIGTAEVRQTFRVSGVGTIAGCMVKQGKIARNANVRLIRDDIVIYEGTLDSLKRFKDDAKEVAEGYECGVGLDKYNDLKEGDIIEAFINEEIPR